jgi:hypothetical protein
VRLLIVLHQIGCYCYHTVFHLSFLCCGSTLFISGAADLVVRVALFIIQRRDMSAMKISKIQLDMRTILLKISFQVSYLNLGKYKLL